MKRNTLIILGVFLALLVTALVVYRTGPWDPESTKLEIPGVREGTTEAADDPEGLIGPATRIQIVRGGVTIQLSNAADGNWELMEPIASLAKGHRVKSMFRAFGEPVTTSLGRTISAEEQVHYGLGEDRRIHVTMYATDEVLIDYWIGDSVKIDDQGTTDTNIMVPETDVVYRVRGRDLRSAFDLPVEDLQDRKIFRFSKDQVQRLVIRDPRDAAHERMVLVRGAEGTDPWLLETPEGYRVGGIDTYCSTLSTLSATRFEAALPGAEAAALDKTYAIEILAVVDEVHLTMTLELGAGRGAVWGRVSGRNGVFQVSTTSADALMKSLSDFRDKRLFAVEKEEIERIELTTAGDDAPILLERNDKAWFFGPGDPEHVSSSEVNRLAAAIASLRAQEFETRPLEGTGLDAPLYSITFVSWDRKEDPVKHQLDIGAAVTTEGKGAKRHWARIDDGAEVIQLADYSVKALRKTREELIDQRVFRVDPEDLVKVTLTYPDQVIVLENGEQGWKVTSPEAIPNPVGVDTIIRTLADLPVRSVRAAVKPEAARLAIGITLQTRLGEELGLSLSEEIVEGGNYAQSPGHPRLGDAVFTVSQYKVSNLLKKLPDLRPEK